MLDILSFLLPKIPPDFDGETSWCTNTLHAFINEFQQQSKSKKEKIDDGLEGWVFEDLNVDEEPNASAGYERHHQDKEIQNVTARLDTLEENLMMSVSDENHYESTSDLESKRPFKRKSIITRQSILCSDSMTKYVLL